MLAAVVGAGGAWQSTPPAPGMSVGRAARWWANWWRSHGGGAVVDWVMRSGAGGGRRFGRQRGLKSGRGADVRSWRLHASFSLADWSRGNAAISSYQVVIPLSNPPGRREVPGGPEKALCSCWSTLTVIPRGSAVSTGGGRPRHPRQAHPGGRGRRPGGLTAGGEAVVSEGHCGARQRLRVIVG